jgi:hypothetical protein
MKKLKRRSLEMILKMRKNVLSYPEVQFAYQLNGLGDSFKFRTAEDVKNVLRWDIHDIPGFDSFSPETQTRAARFIISFLNGWGLEARDTIYPASIEWDKDYKAFKFYYSVHGDNPGYSYLYLNGEVG